MGSLLYDVAPDDGATLSTVVAALAVTSFLACWGPAVRAARVDPVVALRHE
jgi:ABC-type lipoprotein release transport system permease subunit